MVIKSRKLSGGPDTFQPEKILHWYQDDHTYTPANVSLLDRSKHEVDQVLWRGMAHKLQAAEDKHHKSKRCELYRKPG